MFVDVRCYSNALFSVIEERKLPSQRATYEYLRGKIFDVFSEYRKEAEDHLSKAVSNKIFEAPLLGTLRCSGRIWFTKLDIAFRRLS